MSFAGAKVVPLDWPAVSARHLKWDYQHLHAASLSPNACEARREQNDPFCFGSKSALPPKGARPEMLDEGALTDELTVSLYTSPSAVCSVQAVHRTPERVREVLAFAKPDPALLARLSARPLLLWRFLATPNFEL